ncbi:MAG: ribonuclease domain-containing protein [Actinomycetes bacterium]
MRFSRCTAVQLLVATLVAFVALTGCGRGSDSSIATGSPAASTSSGEATQEQGGVLAPTAPTTSLQPITVLQLPPQAVETLKRIRSGGPFPYKQDGVVFQNRERILPKQANGYYHEYTVKKPGESDRGPWRLVTGQDGAVFWTSDHYASFQEVVQP